MDASKLDLNLIAMNQRGRIKNNFSLETKQGALKRIFWDRQPVSYVARDIGISESTVRGWCRVSEKILEPQNVADSKMPPPMDPRQMQLYNNYHYHRQMYYSQVAEPYFGYQHTHIQLEIPPLMPPRSYYKTEEEIRTPSDNMEAIPLMPPPSYYQTEEEIRTPSDNMKAIPLMPPPSYYKSQKKNSKYPNEFVSVTNKPTENPPEKPKIDDRTDAIGAGEVFLAWLSACPEFSSNPNLKVLRGTIERLKNYTPLEKKKKDGILNATRRRK